MLRLSFPNLSRKQRELSFKLANIGFIGNWRYELGEVRLDIFFEKYENNNYITVDIEDSDLGEEGLKVGNSFPGIKFDSIFATEVRDSFKPALSLVVDVFALDDRYKTTTAQN